MARVAVIGAGVGGLTAALLLARQQHEVTVYEKNSVAGGKLAHVDMDGFNFDTGPSLLTLPESFSRLGVDIDLVRLEKPFSYHFADGSHFDVFDNSSLTRHAFEEFAPGAGREWMSMYERGERIWRVAKRTYFAGPMYPLPSLIKRFRSPFDLLSIDPFSTLAQRSASTFADPRLQMWLNRYATYSGSSPWLTPATAGCIPFIEQRFGSWHVVGGLATIARTLAQAAKTAGADIVLNADVTAINSINRKVRAVSVNGERVPYDCVVSNVDAEHLYSSLTPDRHRRSKAEHAGRSTAGFVMLLALSGTTKNINHHNVFFSANQHQEFEEIFNGPGIAQDPTIYVCNSSVTDGSQVPEPGNSENWFVMVNTRAGAVTDWDEYAKRIVQRLGVGDRIVSQRLITPIDMETNFRAPGGAIYGSSSNGKGAAFLRASNRGPIHGLYLVGGSAHPGGGLPLVVRSAEIVAELTRRDQI